MFHEGGSATNSLYALDAQLQHQRLLDGEQYQTLEGVFVALAMSVFAGQPVSALFIDVKGLHSAHISEADY